MKAFSAAGLAFGDNEDFEWKMRMDVYRMVVGHVPADIMQEAAMELLKTARFFPKPAEWLAACDKTLGERHRMLKRVDALEEARNRTPVSRAPETHERLAGGVAVFRKHGKRAEADDSQRRLYAHAMAVRAECERQGVAPPSWTRDGIMVDLHRSPSVLVKIELPVQP